MKNKFPILLLMLAATFSSCVTDERRVDVDPVPDSEKLTIQIAVPGNSSPKTRALTTADEYDVTEIAVLAFDADDKQFYGRYAGFVTDGPTQSIPNSASATMTFQVSLPLGDFDLMVVAGAGSLLDAAASTLVKGTAQAAVLEAVKMTMGTGGWDVDAPIQPLPMWGYKTGVRVPQDFTGTNTSLTSAIRLTRMVAKVDIKLGADLIAADKFELQSVRVYNYIEQGRLIPGIDGAFDWEGVTDLADNTTPTLPTGYTRASSATEFIDYTLAPNATALERSIYLFEAPAGVSPFGDPDDYLENTCLVIGGDYDNSGETTYYRLDFAEDLDPDPDVLNWRYLPLMRNHRYNFTVNAISGAGYDTPGEALNSMPANIDSDILSWDESDLPPDVTGRMYRLTVTPAAHGTALSNYSKALPGMEMIALATPELGYMFTGWIATGLALTEEAALDNPLIFPMPAGDVGLTPQFTVAQYYTVVWGSTKPDEGLGLAMATPGDNVLAGESVMLSLLSESDPADYLFSGWEVTDGDAEAIDVPASSPASFTMPDSHVTAHALFARRFHKVTVGAATGITVTPGTADTNSQTALTTGVYSGTGLSYTATAGSNDIFTGWAVTPAQGVAMDPLPNLSANPLTFAMPKGGVTITPRSTPAALSIAAISPNANFAAADGTSASRTITISSNVTWTASVGNGFTISPTSGGPGGTITVRPTGPNTASTSRSAVITVQGTKGGTTTKKTITVTQAEADYLNISINSSANFAATDGTSVNRKITVSSNVAWTASVDNGNFAVSPTSGGPGGTITLTPKSPNTSNSGATSARTVKVTVTGARGGTATVRTTSVTQSGMAYAVPPSGEVRVGNVIWAKVNLSANNTFAANADDPGALFQWGRSTPYANTGTVSMTGPEYGDTWLEANNPCPTGWRVPNNVEFEAMLDTSTSYEWSNSSMTIHYHGPELDFSAKTGIRTSNTLAGNVTNGYYWTSQLDSDDMARGKRMASTIGWANYYASVSNALAVRCVRTP